MQSTKQVFPNRFTDESNPDLEHLDEDNDSIRKSLLTPGDLIHYNQNERQENRIDSRIDKKYLQMNPPESKEFLSEVSPAHFKPDALLKNGSLEDIQDEDNS